MGESDEFNRDINFNYDLSKSFEAQLRLKTGKVDLIALAGFGNDAHVSSYNLPTERNLNSAGSIQSSIILRIV